MEPLSKSLTDWLFKLRLCTAADLRRCRGRVRQFARDLTAFDSVWIDALVHARKLTPFQARVLESGHPERLAVGPCVLVDLLGQGTSTTYLARHRDSNEPCVLKFMDLPEEHRGAALEAMKQLLVRSKGFSHPAVVVPTACLSHPPHLITVSRYLAGPSLSQLVVRRGRFPARIVLALARQMIDGLAALEERGLVHGELRLQNVRLSTSGQVAMLDAGIGPAVRPELPIYSRIAPDYYDGIAPERIGTGQPADGPSEFYALGCLLWHLLAGRAPYPTGDPLGKLMAHQTRRIPDVREIAPETPGELAEILRVMTDPDPLRRPSSFREFRSRWGTSRRAHRKQLARFRAQFNTAIPHVPAMKPEDSSHHWPMIAGLMLLLCGTTLALMDAGAYSRLLNIPARLESWVSQQSSPNEVNNLASERLLGKPLPAPDANGVIELQEEGPYYWQPLEIVGPLTIRGTAETNSTIVIDDASCQLSATEVVLENLRFRRAATSKVSSATLLRLTCQSAVLRRCAFELASEAEAASLPEPVAVTWQHLDRGHPAGGRVEIENCSFTGAGGGCQLADWPSQVVINNCLKTGPGRLLHFTGDADVQSQTHLSLSHITLRDASGLVYCEMQPEITPGRLTIQAESCVFDLGDQSSGLFQFTGEEAERFFRLLDLQGRNCLLNEAAPVAVWSDSESQQAPQMVDAYLLNVEGLVLAKFSFVGPASDQPADSELTSWQGPRFSASSPGIRPADLPRPADAGKKSASNEQTDPAGL